MPTTRTILVIVSLVLSVTIGLVIASTNRPPGSAQPASAKKVVIGLSLDTLKEERWQRDRDSFVARAAELGAEVNVQSANSDDAAQIQNVTGLLTAGVNVIVIAPHNAQAMARAVELCRQKSVPVIAYDRLIRDCDLDLYLTFDNVRVGQLQGQFIVDQLKSRPPGQPLRIVRIYGSKTDNNALLFKQGQDLALAPHLATGAIVVVQEDWAEDWKPENAKRIMSAALTNTKDIHAVLASNDGTAGGAIQALSEQGLAGKFLVTGQDAELVACQRIVQGTQTMTIYKPLQPLAARAAEAAVALATGRPVIANATVNNGKADVPSIMLDVQVVTKDNMLTTVVQDNFHSRQSVYGN